MTSTESWVLITVGLIAVLLLWADWAYNKLFKKTPIGEAKLWIVKLLFGYGIAIYFMNIDGKRGKTQFGIFKRAINKKPDTH